MKAARLHAYHEPLKLDEIDEPKITGPLDVIVRMGAAGLCRTDLHIQEGQWAEKSQVVLPYTPGHENAGWVHEIGSGVTNVAVGDTVIVHPFIACGLCSPCRRGDDMHCLNGSFPGINRDGGFAQFLQTSARSVVKLAPGLEPKDIAALADAGLLGGPIKTILGLWRAPEQLAAAAPWQHEAALVDIASFGEIGLLPAWRGTDGQPTPIPRGKIAVPRGAPEAVAVIETARSKSGTLTLRGPMVPTQPFPPGVEQGSEERVAPDGLFDTGYACRIARDRGTIVLTAPPAGITATGFYRFRQSEVDDAVAAIDPAAVIVAVPDALLGQRLAGSARDGAAITSELEGLGVNALIAGAFRSRGIAA